MKGKALRRAIQSSDAIRVNTESVPLIVTTTELITPDTAKAMLTHNKKNRPINWRKVDDYAEIMRSGRWRLHDQGLMLDVNGNILTGQKRLWAVIKANVNVYMRVSRGNPSDTADVIDRGLPQSARDLAARETGRVHSPMEVSIARALSVLAGNLKPTSDDLSKTLTDKAHILAAMMSRTKGGKKTRAMLMVIAAMILEYGETCVERVVDLPLLADRLTADLLPRTPEECWGRGVAFSLAMESARRVVLAA